MTRLSRIAIATLLLGACSSNDTPNLGPETDPTPTQQQAIVSVQQSVTDLSNVQLDSSNAEAAALTFALSSGDLFLNANATAVTPNRVLSTALARRNSPSFAPHDTCAVTTDTSITWNNCTEGNETVNGSISWSTGHVDMNVSFSESENGESVTFAIAGSLTVSATAIKSDVTLTGTASGPTANANVKLHTTVDVQLSNGCITSGTLTSTETGSGTSGTMNVSIDEAVQVVWTGCNMFRVRNSA